MSARIYDAIGIGIGPFNLGFAALAEENLDVLLFDQKEEFNWHPGMLIEGTTLQVPFFADLVSMIDVKNKFSFLNYLQVHNRMYHFYFLEKFHIPRKEYNDYCKWVSDQLSSCRFGYEVTEVSPYETEDGESVYAVHVRNVKTLQYEEYMAKHLVMGIGSSPSVPEHLKHALGETVFHSSEFMERKQNAQKGQSIVVVGSGQSAAEIFLNLTREQELYDYSLCWYTRSQGFFPMEYSKLGLEYFSPDYTKFFYQLPQSQKDQLLQKQDLLYKGISADTISDIYEALYEKSIGNQNPALHLQAMSEITELEKKNHSWLGKGQHIVTGESFESEAEVVILATGYKQTKPQFLPDYLIQKDEHGRFQISEDYRLKTNIANQNDVFIQNGELHTHGVGAPDLGLGPHRNATIINQIAQRDVYPVQSKNVFQTFGTVNKPVLTTN
ncbi:SidA/IucD/PvdA family monooxygenase [Pseudalkalibacillus hwajinpoensis]|uniref:lysine N(6)-hydroxylase/L-ornithine N(5)-oxygenase family protein n=1 Tax=Guptibacillus hwajinpoensis TaxID=208199 RepID=UPI00325B2548